MKRWICLYVENEIGVLAKISGLFAAKSYNLNSITVGVTEDQTMSRMTIGLSGDDKTFEQIKKQLNRCVEVIKVIDYTEIPIHNKELLYVKVKECNAEDKQELFHLAQVFKVTIVDCDKTTCLLESIQSEDKNNYLIRVLQQSFCNRLEIVRGGSVAIEAVNAGKTLK